MADRNLSILIKFAMLERVTAPLRKIGGGSRDLSKAIARTRADIAKLGATQAQVGKMKALEERFGADTRALAKERAEIDRLKKAIASTDGPTGNMGKGLANAEKAAAALNRRLVTTGDDISALSRKLEAAGIDTTELARSEDRLARSIYDANQKLRQQKGDLEKAAAAKAQFEKTQALGDKITGAGAAALTTGTALGAPLLASGKAAADFQSQMTDIAQKVNLSRDAGTKLGAQIDALAPKVAVLPTALAEGLDDLAGKGLDPRVAMRMLEPIGKAATAYKAEIADLSAATFAGVDNLKVPISQTGKMLDIMAVAGKAGAFELRDMAQYFPSLTAQAQALGQKGVKGVADLAAALEIARKGAGTSGEAATNLENLLAKINSPETLKKFKKYGIDLQAAMKAGIAQGKSPIETIAELSNKATGGDMSKLGFLFEDQQAQSALRSIMQNLPLYRQIRADALKASGEVDRDFAQRMGDADAKAQHLAASTQTLSHAVGNALLPAAGAVMDKLAGWADKATALAIAHPKLTAGLTTIAGAAAATLVSLGGLGLVGGQVVKGWGYLSFAANKLGILRILPPLFGAVRVAAMFLARGVLQAGMMMLANPVVLAITAIVAAVGIAGYLIYKHWGTIKAAFSTGIAYLSGLWSRFKQMGAQLIDGLTGGILARIQSVEAAISGLGDKVVGWFKSKLGIHSPSRVFHGLGGFLSEGLANGLSAKAHLPVRAMRGIAAGVTAAAVIAPVTAMPAGAVRAAGGMGPSAGAEARYEIHIHAGTGADPQAIARAVSAELDRREREHQARQRSSYRDDQ